MGSRISMPAGMLACMLVLAACTSKPITYTVSIIPEFLDDSMAVVFVKNYTKTKDGFSDYLISKVTAQAFKVNYRVNGAIQVLTKPIYVGNYYLGVNPYILGNIIVLATTQHAVGIDKHSGLEAFRRKDGNPYSRWSLFWIPGEYLLRLDSGAFLAWSPSSNKEASVNPDSIFGIDSVFWHDIYYDGKTKFGILEAENQRNLVLMEPGTSPTKYMIPEMPEPIRKFKEFRIWVSTNSQFIVAAAIGYGDPSGFAYPLDEIYKGNLSSEWIEVGDNSYNSDLSVRSPWLTGEISQTQVSSSKITFHSRAGDTLSEYDFSKFVRR